MLFGRKHKICNMTIYTSNIVDYVSLCERINNQEVSNLLNDYYDIIHKYILDSKGHLEKMIGDRQLAYWDFKKKEESAFQSCQTSIDQLKKINEYNNNLPDNKKFTITIGISSGDIFIQKKRIILFMAILLI